MMKAFEADDHSVETTYVRVDREDGNGEIGITITEWAESLSCRLKRAEAIGLRDWLTEALAPVTPPAR